MIGLKSISWDSSRRAIAVLALCASCGQALADEPPPVPSRQVFYSAVQPLTDTIERVQQDPRPTTAAGALKVFDWLIYGNVSLGAAYDSNVFASPTPQTAYGPRFQPEIIAERNTGIQRTLLYGIGDIRYYPSLGQTDLLNTTAGLTHVWEIHRDLVFRTQFEATRSQQTSGLVNEGGVLFTQPINYTSLFGSASIEKSFGRFFTAIGGSITGNAYDDTKNSSGNVIDEQFQDGTRSTLNARFGYNISPIVYAFVEPSVNVGQFRASNLNSDGYQVAGGLGTGRIGKFTGEIYGGFLTEHFSEPSTPTLTRPIYGGRLTWSPKRFVTVTASVDQRFGTSDFSPTLFTNGSPTIIDTYKVAADWFVLRNVDLQGSVQFQHYDYFGTNRVDDFHLYDVKATYFLTAKLGITLDYNYGTLTSNIPGVAYNRNFVSLGATSHF
jgi:Putative beta-barrel porin 2